MSEWIEIGKLDDIPVRGARVVRTPDGEVAVFRTGDDRLFALDNRCPHKDGPLSEGIVFDHKVACPLHNWKIELETGSAVAPDEGCVRTYPVEVSAEGVVRLCLAQAAA